MSDEDLAELKAQAKFKALRPLTYAAYLLTTSVRGHGMYKEFTDKWEQLESLTQHVTAAKMANYDRSKEDPKETSKAPEDLEEKFGTPKGKPADRWNPMTGKYEEVEGPD
jgi:hypothetical protein